VSSARIALLIDDHVVVRGGVRRALEAHGNFEIYEAASHAEGLAQIAKVNPSLIVIDINLPDGNGLDLVAWVRSISSTTALVVLSLHESDDYVLSAMNAGASCFVQKAAPLSELVASIDHALAAPLSFSARDIAGAISRSRKTFGLSQRELQILSQLHKGAPLKELARSLFITESTLKTHLSSIYRKMQVKNRVQAIEKGKKSGIT
jgi:DNA-binding NarL/FixJ family response regulator